MWDVLLQLVILQYVYFELIVIITSRFTYRKIKHIIYRSMMQAQDDILQHFKLLIGGRT